MYKTVHLAVFPSLQPHKSWAQITLALHLPSPPNLPISANVTTFLTVTLGQNFRIIFPFFLLVPYIDPVANAHWVNDYWSLNSERISIKVSFSINLGILTFLPTISDPFSGLSKVD